MNLRKSYILTFVILAILFLLSFIQTKYSINLRADDSRVINIAGRQRMLSQRIGKEALELQDSLTANVEIKREGLTRHRIELEEAVFDWEEAHLALQHGDEDLGIEGDNSEIIIESFALIEDNFQLMLSASESILQKTSTLPIGDISEEVDIILENELPFLLGMDAIVFQYDNESRKSIGTQELGAFITLALGILMLLILGRFIVRPAIINVEFLDRNKSKFLSTSAHLLRTPLTAISWNSERLLKETKNLGKKEKVYAQDILKNTKRIGETVKTLINVSNIEMGRLIIEPEPQDFVKIIESIIKDFKPQIRSKKIVLEKSLHKKRFTISIDKNAARMIIESILMNAITYTPENGQVTISTSETDSDFIVSIKDTGIGIPKEHKNKIFDKFFRTDKANLMNTSGFGLGLYIIQSILKKTGGRIWFESKEHVGSNFHIAFPKKGMKVYAAPIKLS